MSLHALQSQIDASIAAGDHPRERVALKAKLEAATRAAREEISAARKAAAAETRAAAKAQRKAEAAARKAAKAQKAAK